MGESESTDNKQYKTFFGFIADLLSRWFAEATSQDLQEASTHREILQIINKLETQTPPDEIHSEVYRALMVILKKIYVDYKNIRLAKLLLRRLFGEETPKNITPEEKDFLDRLERILTHSEEEHKEQFDIEAMKINITKKQKEREIVISKVKLPEFVGTDLLTYRGIDKGTIASIPQKNIELFLKKNAKAVERIKK